MDVVLVATSPRVVRAVRLAAAGVPRPPLAAAAPERPPRLVEVATRVKASGSAGQAGV
ncbi:MAG: hypothetical protein UZ22_OP11002001002, partial [Microgenomates bacterium OLB23]